MTVQVRNESKGTVLVVQGTFDVADADALHDALHAITREKPVTIDFHLVRLFNDCAVARLLQEIADRPGHLTLIGLSEHHHRLLRYVGSDQASRLPH
jgi:anti-anti-sigma regulatory factor